MTETRGLANAFASQEKMRIGVTGYPPSFSGYISATHYPPSASASRDQARKKSKKIVFRKSEIVFYH